MNLANKSLEVFAPLSGTPIRRRPPHLGVGRSQLEQSRLEAELTSVWQQFSCLIGEQMAPKPVEFTTGLSNVFGNDSIFMDVAAILFAVSFPDFIVKAIGNSKVLIALIDAQWLTKTHQADDLVRMEIEVAIAKHIPVLPVLANARR